MPSSGSQTGRVTPRTTSNATSASGALRASILSTPLSRSCWRLAMDRTSASAREETQLTHWPAWMTPTEKVQSGVVMASISRMRVAISLIAERPSERRAPAWEGLPVVAMLKRAMA